MQNTYISSALPVRSNGSLSFSFNDYCYFFSERIEKSSSPPCTCCALSIHGVPIYPRFLYGLRQSSLIQWSASRRLILAGFNRSCRLPLYLDRDCCGVSSSLKESSVYRRRRRRGGNFGCMVWEERSESCDSGTDRSAEEMLSLLTEVSEKFVDRSAVRRELVEKIERVVDERSRKEKDCVQAKSLERNSKGGYESGTVESSEVSSRTKNHGLRRERCRKEKDCAQAKSLERNSKSVQAKSLERNSKGGYESSTVESSEVSSRTKNHGLRRERCRKEKDCAQAKSLERNSKGEYKSIAAKSREDYYQQSGRREASSRTESQGHRRDGSGSSSYFSVSSSGDIESDTNVQVKHAEFVGESSSDCKQKELRNSRRDVLRMDATKQFKMHDEDVSGHREILRQRNAAESAMGSDTMMSGHEWDTRSKAEKKMTKVSVAPVESREESSQRISRKLEVNESGVEMVLSQQKQFSGREEDSTSAVNLVEETTQRNSQRGSLVYEHAESRRKSKQIEQVSESHGSDFQMASSSQKRISGREEKTSAVNSVQVAREGRRQTVNETIEQTELRKKSRQLTKVSEDSNIESSYTSQILFKTGMDNREENSTTFQSSIQKSNEQPTQIDQRVYGATELRRESQDLTNMPEMTSDATETITSTQTLSETRMSGRERKSSSIVVNLVPDERQNGSQTGERVIGQVGLIKESQRPMKVSSLPRSTTETTSSSKTPLYSVPQAGVQLMGVLMEDDRNSQVILEPPPSQLVDVKTGNATMEVCGEFSESSSSYLFIHPQAQTPTSPHQLNVETRTNEGFGENPSHVLHEDSLGSASRFQSFSSQFVGEFVEKVQDEILTSEVQKERTSEIISVYRDGKYIQQAVGQYASEDLQLKRPASRHSSDVSGLKGPSDEIWDVKDPSLHGSSQREAPEEGTSTSGSAIVRRSGRSFWNIIADIVRMRWVTRSEANLALKSGGRISSNESVGGEAWFSGHEVDDNDGENVKKQQRGTATEPRSADQLRKASTRSQTEASEGTSFQDGLSEAEADTASYSGTLERGVTSQGTSSASGKENFGWKEDGRSDQGIPSTVAPEDSSLPLLDRHLIRSPIIEQMPESSKSKVSRADFMENVEQPNTERSTEVPGTHGKDSGIKRRKFQRNKQVPRDRFDEWEKAYKLETEQRKFDEMFMREALLEAQKAADIWEVPVGAVLVQNGEIIARGCNLVEELRDSTAHAEMICIREASNLLRTWRLADTTLYVTLEPCPMCAGAILQARIDSVVWGAPNKLLGADGSWVRLFPGGGEGGSSSDPANQPAGPIHPFHPKFTIRRGVLETECAEVMQQFFHLRRKKKEKKPEPETQPSCLPVSTHPSKFLSKMHDMFSIMFCL